MKVCIVILFLIFLCNLNAQKTFSVNKIFFEFSGPSSRDFTYYPSSIANTTSITQTYTWKRTIFNPQQEWKLFTWDSGNRYNDTTNFGEFTLSPSEINTFVCEVKPFKVEGTATINYTICNKIDTSDCATITFVFKTNLFTDIEVKQDNNLNTYWLLFDVYGRLINEFNSYPTTEELNSYGSGLFFLVNYKHKKYIKILN